MDKWYLAVELLKELNFEVNREGINDKYHKALRDTIDNLEELKNFW